MKHYSLCPICGDEKLHEVQRLVTRKSDGYVKKVPFHASVCESCGCETLTERQALFNKRAMTNFYREADGLLTGEQIKYIRLALNLTQAEASTVFGGGKNAFTKYEKGDVTQSCAMDKLIRTANAVPEAFEYLSAGCPEKHINTINIITSGIDISDITTVETIIQVIGSAPQPRKSLLGSFRFFGSERNYETNAWENVLAAG
ncbi:type II toxin-antitoxin system MqsA family antitoxin [Pantoea agglomerans]|uniref:type II toxin-antitoxin system MqsA family antitoxin n=1 Tax=Enterobacter agglomerans TaxID=549 RepID=UPI0023AE8453|nr:type II toxin-antitoxin system MqsA family antitoxin [Pantoea agglomerans]WEC73647.1 type II toxin-antitoxin system MqsA family antitoxin [Pantoea agglomerans]